MVLANIGLDDEAEFNRWYDREHMRERVEVPGFISAQRYVSDGHSRWKYLALYETEGVSTFYSPVYRQALANQSAWSKQILARFRDPQRSVAERTCRIGYGIGGTVTVTRLRPRAGEGRRLATLSMRRRFAPPCQPSGRDRSKSDRMRPRYSPNPSRNTRQAASTWSNRTTGSCSSVGLAPKKSPSKWRALCPSVLVETVERIGSFSLLWDLHRSEL